MNFKNKGFWAGLAVIVAGIGMIVAEKNYGGGITQIITGVGIAFASHETAKE